MFSELLGQMMEAGMSNTSRQRVDHAMGAGGLAAPDSPLAAIFGTMTGGGGAGGAGGAAGTGAAGFGGAGGGLGGLSGALGGLAESAKGMLGDAGRSVQGGNPLAIGGLGALAGALLGGGGGAAKGAVGGGALALLGGIAMQALQSWNAGQGAAAPSADEVGRTAPLGLRAPQTQAEEDQLESKAELVLRAMISAAKADGEIDAAEAERIMGKLKASGTDEAARRFIQEEIRKPVDLAGLVSQVQSPEMAVEVYAASLLAIEVDTRAEQTYLADLARGLSLHPGTVRRVHEVLGVA